MIEAIKKTFDNIVDSLKFLGVQFLFHLKSIILLVFITAMFIYAFNSYFAIAYVSGESMEPTFYSGNVLLLHKSRDLEVDQIAIAEVSQNDTSKKIIKRVTGLPGDIIEVIDGKLYVNNDVHGSSPCEVVKPFKIPTNKVFLVGDNRELSSDGLRDVCYGGLGYVDSSTVIMSGDIILKLGGSN